MYLYLAIGFLFSNENFNFSNLYSTFSAKEQYDKNSSCFANPLKYYEKIPPIKTYSHWDLDSKFIISEKIPVKKAKNILLATSWRSGSTFLGDLLNHYPGTFYSFEPLHYLRNRVCMK